MARKRTEREPSPAVHDEFAYREGRQAWGEGKTEDDNPYRAAGGSSIQRRSWFSGWYDGKYAKFPKVNGG